MVRGYRIPQPPGCSDAVYAMMLQCWDADPEKRPAFRTLQRFFAEQVDVPGFDLPESGSAKHGSDKLRAELSWSGVIDAADDAEYQAFDEDGPVGEAEEYVPMDSSDSRPNKGSYQGVTLSPQGFDSVESSDSGTLERPVKRTSGKSNGGEGAEPAYTHPAPLQSRATEDSANSYVPLHDETRRGAKDHEKVYKSLDTNAFSGAPPLDADGYVAGLPL